MKTYVYELIDGITSHVSPGSGHMKDAETLYSRYLEDMKERCPGVQPLTLAAFLLTKIESSGFDSFVWEKGTLVRVKATGKLGQVTGWCFAGIVPYRRIEVTVRTADGDGSFRSGQIEKAEVPPEILEYVASTLKDRVHGKVDEAFEGGGDGQ